MTPADDNFHAAFLDKSAKSSVGPPGGLTPLLRGMLDPLLCHSVAHRLNHSGPAQCRNVIGCTQGPFALGDNDFVLICRHEWVARIPM